MQIDIENLITIDEKAIESTPEFNTAVVFTHNWPDITIEKLPLFVELLQYMTYYDAHEECQDFLNLFNYVVYHYYARGEPLDPIVIDQNKVVIDGLRRACIFRAIGLKTIEAIYGEDENEEG